MSINSIKVIDITLMKTKKFNEEKSLMKKKGRWQIPSISCNLSIKVMEEIRRS